MYDDVLKEKENVVIKVAQAEEEKKRVTRENDLLGKKVSENARVCLVCFAFGNISMWNSLMLIYILKCCIYIVQAFTSRFAYKFEN